MTFHMWRRSLMTLILCGRRSIWWSWRVLFRGRRSTSWHFGRQPKREVVFFNTKSSPRSDQKGLRSGGCEMTISCSDYPPIMLGLSSNRLSIGWSNSGILRWNVDLRISRQAQYLVKLEGDFACSAYWKWRLTFICHAEQWWDSFCVAGAVFGEVGWCLLLFRAL